MPSRFLLPPFLFMALATIACSVVQPRQTGEQSLADAAEATSTPHIEGQSVTLDSQAFIQGGVGQGVAITSIGVTLDADIQPGSAGQFVVAETAPFPFNVVVPHWQVALPPGSRLEIFLRTAPLEGEWTTWYRLQENPDLTLPEDTMITGDFIATSGSGVLHQRVEVAANLLPGPDGASPTLQAVRLTYIDSTAAPPVVTPTPTTRLVEPQAVDAYPKPPVVGREAWCFHPDCNYSSGLDYYPVTHLIIHHTVSSNNNTDWPANVRAIWYYHTFEQGWGDIGYNYLVDPNGVIYEGHIGGDDVVGTHASGANRGSMGVALLGTFSVETPSEPMLDALADLLAWKTDQKTLDLLDASQLPDLDWGLLHLVGHRDVYGTTVCPGSAAHLLLPDIRQRVYERLGFTTSYTYSDDLSDDFTLSNANWYDGPLQCGLDTHAYYTFSTTDPAQAVNWGEWRPTIPASGLYELGVYVPRCNTGELDTQEAIYKVHHADGVETVIVNQEDNLGLWVTLGAFPFNSGASGSLWLGDLTTQENGRLIWFDAVRLRFLETALLNLAPAADEWLTQRTVAFLWQVNHSEPLETIQLQVATDAGFANLVLAQSLDPTAVSYTHTFTQDYPDLYWRIAVTTTSGNVLFSDPTRFHLDATPPTSELLSLYETADGSYQLTWAGNDATAGIDNYTIAYRPPSSNSWITLLDNTTLTRTLFTPPDPNAIYDLRVQAVDRAGNAEPLKVNGDASTADAIPYLGEPPILLAPIGNLWQTERLITFAWDISVLEAVTSLQLEASTQFNLANPVLSVNLTPAQNYSYTFTQDYNRLYWRLTLTTVLGEQFTSSVASFRLDATPPTARVRDAYATADGAYELQFESSDTLSGIERLTLEYQVVGAAGWLVWSDELSGEPILFTPPTPGQPYAWRVQAHDVAGNVEAPHTRPDITSDQAIPYLGTPAQAQEPINNGWRANRAVTFRWTVEALAAVTTLQLQVASDPAFTTLLVNRTFALPVLTYSHTFSQDYAQLYWRVNVTTVLGEVFNSPAALFRLDATPPTSDLLTLVEQAPGGVYLATWAGSDALSGLSGFLAEYRAEDETLWQVWYSGPDTSALFTPPDSRNYWLRTRAVDVAGNVEAGDRIGDLSLADAVPYRIYRYFPVVRR